MRRALRWTRRIVLGAFAFAVVALGAVLIAIHTDWGRNVVRERAVKALAGAFPGGAKIARIDGSVFGELVISGIELDGSDGTPLVTVGTVKVRVALAPLLSRIVRIESLEIDDVALAHREQAAPASPAPPPVVATAAGEPSPWTIEVDHVEVHRASAVIATQTRTLDFHDLELDARASVERGAITAVVGARGMWADRKIAATATAHYDRGVLAVPFAAASAARAHARVMGLRIGDVIEGVVAAFVPAATAAAVAQLHVPGDIAVAASATADGALDVHASVGDATLRAIGQASLVTRSASALVIAEVPDGAKLDPRFAGHALVTAALEGSAEHVRGMIAIDGTRPMAKQLLGKDEVRGTALLAVDAMLANAWVLLESDLDVGATRATAIAELARAKDGSIALAQSTLVATASKVGARATDAHVGYLVATAAATGPLYPKPALKVTGMLDGDELRYGAIAASSVDARFDTRHITEANVHVDVGAVRSGATLLGSASFDVRAALGANGAVDVAIDKHAITTAANGVWSGSGGRIRIDDKQIVISDLHTGNGGGTVVANATVDRETGNLRGAIDAKGVALATLAPRIQGTLDATLAVQRRGGAWRGTGQLAGRGVVVHGQAPMDVDVALQLAGRRIEVATTATAPEGKATVSLDLDGPYDITSGAAWKRLDRKALRDVAVAVDHLELQKVGASGTVTGKLELTATGASGDLALRGLATKRGNIDADIALGPDPRGPLGVLAQVKAQLEGVDTVAAAAQLELPARPFDPAEWQALGRTALHHATVTLAPLDFDPAVLAKAHLDQPYHGHLEAKLDVSEGASSATATIDVTKLAGGAIVKPVDVHLEADVDRHGVHVTGGVLDGPQQLVAIDVAAPLMLDRLAAFAAEPLSGTIAIPQVPAAQIVAVLGRRDVTAGVVDGTIKLGGIVKRPTADVAITATGVTIPSSFTGRPATRLDSFHLSGTWDGTAGKLAIDAREAQGGTLAVAAAGRPDQLAGFDATVKAVKLDVAPFSAFAVGAFSAARGTVDANLALHGLDPDTGDVRGQLDIHDGRLPLSPLLGTLRQLQGHIDIANHQVAATVTAKLGKGDLKGTAAATLVGSTPSKATANVVLHQISLVRAFQPTIDATVDATFTHGKTWNADVAVHRGSVVVATTGGVSLLPADAPSDIQFTDQAPSKLAPLLQRPPPAKPWLIADVSLLDTGVEVLQDEFQVRGNVGGKLKISFGDGIGMEGTLEATTQNIELLGARSQLDHANVTWDGTLDPMLDVSVIRELTDLTITAAITGRLSKPQIALSSDSGSYTQGELIGYFLGGTPSADRSDVSQTAAAAGAGAASALVTSQLRKVLPGWASKYGARVSLNYEVATSSSSEAVRVGYWISKHVFVAVHSHLEPLPDENANEGIGEWHFRSNMMLQGNAGDRGIAGLDLVRRWHW